MPQEQVQLVQLGHRDRLVLAVTLEVLLVQLVKQALPGHRARQDKQEHKVLLVALGHKVLRAILVYRVHRVQLD